jgi:hypothetical protein
VAIDEFGNPVIYRKENYAREKNAYVSGSNSGSGGLWGSKTS